VIVDDDAHDGGTHQMQFVTRVLDRDAVDPVRVDDEEDAVDEGRKGRDVG
jgi:hypothetical protein